jgi:dihydropteroate synthase
LKRAARNVYANLAGVEVGDGFPVRIVGAINVSAESFYTGSVAHGRPALRRMACRMVAEGAAVLDIGAMSTAPYGPGAIDEAEELRRLVEAVDTVRAAVAVPISVDTQRGRVAAAALRAGATIINDVSGLGADPAMAEVAGHADGVILMACAPAPSSSPPLPLIDSLLRAALRRARAARVAPERLVLDPGIGFFRRAAVPWYAVDCQVLAQLGRLRRLGRPLLVGISRKSFVGKLTGRADPAQRLYGSLSAAALAVYNGADVVRTHDVAATVDAVRVAEAIRAAQGEARRPKDAETRRA